MLIERNFPSRRPKTSLVQPMGPGLHFRLRELTSGSAYFRVEGVTAGITISAGLCSVINE